MTAVVGILNKRGVAIAADSAVTRSRGRNQKVTKNGNKMLRLCNSAPISIMLTGNADFIWTPWDVIIRRYRQQRGDIEIDTVEDCVKDFFDYISQNNVFWNKELVSEWIKRSLENLINMINGELSWEVCRYNMDGKMQMPKTYLKTFASHLLSAEKKFLKNSICPQFEGYTIQQFHEYVSPIIDDFFEEKCKKDEDRPFDNSNEMYLQLLTIRNQIEHTLMLSLITRSEEGPYATLVFCGFGTKENYPTLVAARVCEGLDNRVNYHIRPKDIFKIDDEHPVAICPFAQDDVVKSTLRGIHRSFSGRMVSNINSVYQEILENGFCDGEQAELFDDEFFELLRQVKTDDLNKKFHSLAKKVFDSNQHTWEKALMDYDLQSMASLAGNLIELTGFHRILTFKQEGVGGPVDLAVISKTEGFTWLSRKSWYHHKDVNGQYGKFGV